MCCIEMELLDLEDVESGLSGELEEPCLLVSQISVREVNKMDVALRVTVDFLVAISVVVSAGELDEAEAVSPDAGVDEVERVNDSVLVKVR